MPPSLLADVFYAINQPSDIHLGAQLDDPIGRDLELIRGAQGVALQQHKEFAAQVEVPGALLHDQ